MIGSTPFGAGGVGAGGVGAGGIISGQLDCLVALTSLPGMGPRRLRAVLAEWEPIDAWRAITLGRLRLANDVSSVFGGRLPVWLARWTEESRGISPDGLLRTCRRLGIEILAWGVDGYPPRLATDVDPPMLLFVQGDLTLLDGGVDGAAIVGTRKASAYGLDVAFRFGSALAEAGVAVVSGLATGIDGSAHRGALSHADGRAPIGVVGSGLDVVYPRSNRDLWRNVGERGVLVSESPPGVVPEAWRFPSRNRIIAALSGAVVVVESAATGGSMLTADEATSRQIPVLAVPGSVHSPVSVGPNSLIFDGCSPARSADDVLGALGWFRSPSASPACGVRRRAAPTEGGGGRSSPAPPSRGSADPSLDPNRATAGAGRRRVAADALFPDEAAVGPIDAAHAAVLDHIGWEPVAFDDLVDRTGLTVGGLALVVEALVSRGAVGRERGYVRRVPPR